ncbi:hypothetical protein NQZ68_027548 [Dissostichus eleginoides]|nr:hypothetical protein NQZ68_027548 [Dissostichus eleginoides]
MEKYRLTKTTTRRVRHSPTSPVGQLESDSPIRASPAVQRLCAAVSDTKLSLSLNNCQSAPSTLTPLAASPRASPAPLWTLIGSLRKLPEPSMALLSSLASN